MGIILQLSDLIGPPNRKFRNTPQNKHEAIVNGGDLCQMPDGAIGDINKESAPLVTAGLQWARTSPKD